VRTRGIASVNCLTYQARMKPHSRTHVRLHRQPMGAGVQLIIYALDVLTGRDFLETVGICFDQRIRKVVGHRSMSV
jgi:hypothetical protein